ncbi:TonB-dependent receptor [Sphingomonas sp. KR1UV-12]|uniref:TonB-dependent receptor n=1 Tax=Sphingomonas aurea TaxID=3063994 RepID=A0ABT9EFU9_9SPHN|nr:TonB-dependent receptor [Sphingomonas sp. KR1UV-12]MDP1025732.1 TonB-dependent receptor [Sphingomonas sp. KR1UV-12]
MLAQAGSTTSDGQVAPDQPTAPTGDVTERLNSDGSNRNDEIVVTGSRIKRRPGAIADSVLVIGRDEATQAGFSTTTDLLQSTAITNGTSQINNAYGGYVTNGGPGANTLSLRGVGASRTLLLLNGRRLAPSGSRGAVGSADLNSLPSSVVDRVEVLNSGASSIYGSDAVAGVVNIVTRTVEGIELNGEVNVPEVGAGVQRRVALAFGHKADNFRFTGALEYYKRDDLTFGDRGFTQCQTQYRNTAGGGAPGSGDLIDPLTGVSKCYPTGNTGENGVTINTLGTRAFAGNTVFLAPGVPAGYGTLPTSAGFGTIAQQVCNRFRPNASVTTGALPGYECVGGGLLGLNIRDTNPSTLLNQSLISPTENFNGFLTGAYELNRLGDAELYAELLVNRRKSSQLGQRQLSIDYNQGSLLLPDNLRNNTFLAYSAAGTPTGIPGTPVAARAFTNYGNYDNRQTVDFVKIGGGLRGNLPASWSYDLYVSRSWSDSEYTTDLVLTNRLAQSLDVVASGGGFACRNPIGGCVAAPALNAATIGGAFPRSWIDYITAPVTGTTKFRETVYSANVTGPLFKLPGGSVQAAIGFEQREQSIDDTPAEDSQNNNLYSFTSSSITRGKDRVREVYGELEAPILHEQFIYDLTLTGSARYTDYRSYGSNTTWKFGGTLAPVRWLTLRGTYGSSFRAPQLFEQFLGATTGFQASTTDPCNNLSANTAAIRRTNCLADGIPLGFVATSGVTVNQRGGADSGLSSETSTNLNLGGVFEPRFANGSFSFSADYFRLKIKDGVSQLSFATVLSQCYDSVEFRQNSVCNLVQRSVAAPYQLSVTTGYVNISNYKLTGIDYTARFAHDVGPGRFRLNAQVTQFFDRINLNLPTDPSVNLIGLIANPKFSGVFDAGYTYDRWNVRYGVEWTDATDSTDYLEADDTYNFKTKDYFIHTLSMNYRADNFGLTFGVRNLLDKDPPQISSGAYNRVGNAPLYSGYDYVGRTFFASVTTKF